MPSSRPMPARRIDAKTGFLPARIGASIPRERRLDMRRRELEVAGHLIGEKQRDLAQQLAEARRRRVLVAHQRELVLDEGVVDDVDALHHGLPVAAAAVTAVIAPDRHLRQAGGRVVHRGYWVSPTSTG